MVWVSSTIWTPRQPRRILGPPLLRSMCFSLRWLPSMAKHENWEKILHLRGKKYMQTIHKSYNSSLGHYNTKWALPILILHSRSLPTSPSDSQSDGHAYTHISAKLSNRSLPRHANGGLGEQYGSKLERV